MLRFWLRACRRHILLDFGTLAVACGRVCDALFACMQVTMVWGLGGGVGVIGGGYVGQWIYNRTPPRMPLAAGAVTAASVFPMWWVTQILQ